MTHPVSIILCSIILFSCSANKKATTGNELASGINEIPACLETKIKTMAADPNEGSPISVTRYQYSNQTVYYMVSPCCDKYNVVYDSACNVLGYPDGGYTGRGDAKMPNFKKEAKDEKMIWEKGSQNKN